jgi:benzoate membrane transport protein
MHIEKGDFVQNFKDLPGNINARTISAGILPGVFTLTTILILIGAGAEAHLDSRIMVSWTFSVYIFAGLTGFMLSTIYRQPIPGAWSIPGVALVLVGLKTFSFPEMVGAYLVANLIVALVGFSGLMGKLIRVIPLPIVLAMIVGVLIDFGIGIFRSVAAAPLLAGTAVATYLIISSTRFKNTLPPVIVALCVAMGVALLTGQIQSAGPGSTGLMLPSFWLPEFSLAAIVSVSIPLALLVLCGEMPKAVGILLSQEYNPPTNAMTAYCGIAGVLGSFFGAVNVNIAGPMTAMCASPDAGPKEGRYAAVLIVALFFVILGLTAGMVVPFIIALPLPLISAVAGLAIMPVLLGGLQSTFQAKRFQTGAFFSLVIAMSGVTLLGVAAPVWALIGGVVVSFFVERDDFRALPEQ